MTLTVHFIGTMHYDPLGASRLEKALAIERPDAIACELSPKLWEDIASRRLFEVEKRFLDECKRRGLRQEAYEYFLEQLQKIQFEPRISLAYGQREGIPVHWVDSEKRYDEERPKIEKVIEKTEKAEVVEEYVRYINRMDLNKMRTQTIETDIIEKQYAYFHKLFTGQNHGFFHRLREWRLSLKNKAAILGRDDHAEAEIREKVSDGKLVIVYGAAHCLHDLMGYTLFSRLQDFKPTRTVLADERYR